jgi:hypothetical protein
MSSRTAYKHVSIDERGRAFVEGTEMKVADLILFQRPSAGVRRSCTCNYLS